jgi:hypothetical protein
MALCKDVFGLLQDLMALSEAEPETYCDFRVHCKDGVVEIPKLIVQVCKNNYICSLSYMFILLRTIHKNVYRRSRVRGILHILLICSFMNYALLRHRN